METLTLEEYMRDYMYDDGPPTDDEGWVEFEEEEEFFEEIEMNEDDVIAINQNVHEIT